MRSPVCWIGIVAAVLFVACARPPVLRDGVPVPYEEAAAADLVSAREHLAGGRPDEARQILDRFLVELDQSSRMDEALFLLGAVRESRTSAAGLSSWWDRSSRITRACRAPLRPL